MDFALVVSALMLGLAGAPHCAAMCGAACTAATRGGGAATPAAFHVSRMAGYTLAGAVASSSKDRWTEGLSLPAPSRAVTSTWCGPSLS